jgi:hypothetical protein
MGAEVGEVKSPVRLVTGGENGAVRLDEPLLTFEPNVRYVGPRIARELLQALVLLVLCSIRGHVNRISCRSLRWAPHHHRLVLSERRSTVYDNCFSVDITCII